MTYEKLISFLEKRTKEELQGLLENIWCDCCGVQPSETPMSCQDPWEHRQDGRADMAEDIKEKIEESIR